MKKFFFMIITAVIVISLNVCAMAEDVKNAKNITKKQKRNKESVERYRKNFFGDKEKDIGKEYAAQSTAGVGGATDEGIKQSEKIDNLDTIKDSLYNDSIKTINNVVGSE
ncbi:MAG: hypothetical protein A2Y25_05890 [Candidatus Melainabacteria bacterium GWF2_37_15]|nr:MAG: hypothetical protein A2Y25_05890 [Candidatus Melainabacteria bacterium GWF2_37_15]